MHKSLCACFCGKPVESVENVKSHISLTFRLPRAIRVHVKIFLRKTLT